jgi:hypothetical protein
MSVPTIHLTNFASHQKHHGPGLVWSIMRWTPQWAYSAPRWGGWLEVLTPDADDLSAVLSQSMSLTAYEAAYVRSVQRRVTENHEVGGVRGWELTPGVLGDSLGGVVCDGDTLCCTCSCKKAAARACHRVYAARLLSDAGWTVMLDGQLFGAPPESAKWLL